METDKARLFSELWLEQKAPLIGALLAAVIFFFLPTWLRQPERGAEILSSITQVCSILAGFLATAMTFVLGLRDSPSLKWLQGTRYYLLFVRYMWKAVISQISAAVVALIALLLIPQAPALPPWYAMWMVMITTIWAGISGLRVLRVLRLIMEHDTKS